MDVATEPIHCAVRGCMRDVKQPLHASILRTRLTLNQPWRRSAAFPERAPSAGYVSSMETLHVRAFDCPARRQLSGLETLLLHLEIGELLTPKRLELGRYRAIEGR